MRSLSWHQDTAFVRAAAKTSQAKAGKAAPGSGMPSPEQMFARVHKHRIDWEAPVEA